MVVIIAIIAVVPHTILGAVVPEQPNQHKLLSSFALWMNGREGATRE